LIQSKNKDLKSNKNQLLNNSPFLYPNKAGIPSNSNYSQISETPSSSTSIFIKCHFPLSFSTLSYKLLFYNKFFISIIKN